MIVKLIGDHDKEFRAAAWTRCGAARGPASHTQLFAAQLPKLDASAQIALLDALADRGDGPPGRPCSNCSRPVTDENVRAAAIWRWASWASRPICRCWSNRWLPNRKAEQAAARRSSDAIARRAINQDAGGRIAIRPPRP